MPLIEVRTNQDRSPAEFARLAASIESLIAREKGDPVRFIGVSIDTVASLRIGGNVGPAAVVHLWNAELPAELTSRLTRAFSELLERDLGVSANQLYLFFHPITEPALVGLGGATFAEHLAARRTGAHP
jgi:phenylpyruvate tautomerase PptA (4-oxalocrotonate tautomerase family)